MKKSELKALVREAISEMYDDPYAGVKFAKSVTTLDPVLTNEAKKTNATLSQLHAKLKSAVLAKYGEKFTNIEIYFEVNAQGKSTIHVSGNNPEIEHGGRLDVKIASDGTV
jgi:hypothetical protein